MLEPEPVASKVVETHDDQLDIPGTTTSKSRPLLSDGTHKIIVVILTAFVLLYPIVLATFFDRIESLALWIGAAILGANVFFALVPLKNHLHELHARGMTAKAKVVGMVEEKAGGANAVEDLLAAVDDLFSWRYFYVYVGWITAILYLWAISWSLIGLLVWVAAKALPSLHPSESFMQTTGVLVFAYYAIAIVARLLLRPYLERHTHLNGH